MIALKALFLLFLCLGLANTAEVNPYIVALREGPVEINFPQYIQSPLPTPLLENSARSMNNVLAQELPKVGESVQIQMPEPLNSQPIQQKPQKQRCISDTDFFNKPDECLARRPFATMGFPAFKNEDFLKRKGFAEREGCVFILSNGLFKNFNINKSSFKSDGKCLDSSKASMLFSFSNVTLSYLWELRCINKANQLLDDATLDSVATGTGNVCVGSSQSIGFSTLQLSSLETEVQFMTDIFKNWRVTNVTVDMVSPRPLSSARNIQTLLQTSGQDQNRAGDQISTGLKEFSFELLDGDEMNWRYQQLYQNWTRNKLHVNFIEQFRRFLWISLQRCLSEMNESSTVNKLPDLFANKQYN